MNPRKKLNEKQKLLRKEKREKKKLIAEKDREWHKKGLEKWGKECFFHNSDKKAKEHKRFTEYCHHFRSKRMYPELRHNTDNAIPICWPCHFRLEQVDKSMMADIVEKRGLEWLKKLGN